MLDLNTIWKQTSNLLEKTRKLSYTKKIINNKKLAMDLEKTIALLSNVEQRYFLMYNKGLISPLIYKRGARDD